MKKILNILLAVSLILTSLVVPVWAVTVNDAVGEYLYYYDFSEGSSLAGWTDSSLVSNGVALSDILAGTETPISKVSYSITPEGTLKMTKTGSGYTYLRLPNIPYAAEQGQLVVSFRFKMSSSTGGLISRGNYCSDMYKVYNGKIYMSANDGSGQVGTFSADEWRTITCVYDNDSTNYDFYLDGVYVGTKNTTTTKYLYSSDGFWFSLAFSASAGATAEFDDVMIYTLPAGLTYQVAEANTSSLTLQFNMIPNTVAPANFTVPGATIATAEKDATDPRKVVLTFAENLTPGTNYTVTATGLTAGAADANAIATALSLTTTGAVPFSSGAAADVPYAVSKNLLYKDYEDMALQTFSTTTEFKNAVGAYDIRTGNASQYSIAGDASNKYIRMTYDGSTGMFWRMVVASGNLAKGASYVLEYRVRPNFSGSSYFDGRCDSIWGVPVPRLTGGEIRIADGVTDVIGSYENNEWITITNVFHGSFYNVNGTDYFRRDTYINGVYADTHDFATSAYPTSAYVNPDNFWFSFRFAGTAADQTVDIDYIKVTQLNDDLTLKIEDAENVAADKMNVKFNNVPNAAELLTKVSVEDAEGNTIAISGVEYVNNNNEGTGYETSVNLVFAERLKGETPYTLVVSGLSDSVGNVLNTVKTFTTDSFIEYGALTEAAGKASITINNVTSTTRTYTLIYAGYERNNDDSVKMTVYTAKEISVVPGTQTYTTDAIDVSDCDYTQAYLWDGMTSVVPAEIFD